MPVGVVHLLEIIEVDGDHGHLRALAPREAERPGEHLVEATVVHEAGQRVGGGEAADPHVLLRHQQGKRDRQHEAGPAQGDQLLAVNLGDRDADHPQPEHRKRERCGQKQPSAGKPPVAGSRLVCHADRPETASTMYRATHGAA